MIEVYPGNKNSLKKKMHIKWDCQHLIARIYMKLD